MVGFTDITGGGFSPSVFEKEESKDMPFWELALPIAGEVLAAGASGGGEAAPQTTPTNFTIAPNFTTGGFNFKSSAPETVAGVNLNAILLIGLAMLGGVILLKGVK